MPKTVPITTPAKANGIELSSPTEQVVRPRQGAASKVKVGLTSALHRTTEQNIHWDIKVTSSKNFNYLARSRAAGMGLTPKCVATGHHPPYKSPGKTPLAPWPIAIAPECPPSTSIPSLAPRSASLPPRTIACATDR
jgi:hypothetical protein